MAELRRADSKGRVVLGIGYKNTEWLLEKTADGGFVLTPKVRLREPARLAPNHPVYGRKRLTGEVA